MNVDREDVERAARCVATERRRNEGELIKGESVNFSVTPLDRDYFLADSTNGADLKGR